MSFSPEQYAQNTAVHIPPQEVAPEVAEHVDVPVEIAIAFQTMIMSSFYQNEDGRPFEYDNEAVINWISKYGEAFRKFCDAHPKIAKHINTGIVTSDEERQMYLYEIPTNGKQITPEEMDELVAYLKANPAEEIPETVH